VEHRGGVLVNVFLDLLVGDLRRRAREGYVSVGRRVEQSPGRRGWKC